MERHQRNALIFVIIALAWAYMMVERYCNTIPPDPILGGWKNKDIEQSLGYLFKEDGSVCLYFDLNDPKEAKNCGYSFFHERDTIWLYNDRDRLDSKWIIRFVDDDAILVEESINGKTLIYILTREYANHRARSEEDI